MTRTRTITSIALAAATFGGAIGALATAAVQSQASPVAIAGAVQRVTDTTAERSLKSIANELATIQTELNSLPTLTQPSPVNGIQVPIVLALLPEIWMNTLPQGPFSCPV